MYHLGITFNHWSKYYGDISIKFFTASYPTGLTSKLGNNKGCHV